MINVSYVISEFTKMNADTTENEDYYLKIFKIVENDSEFVLFFTGVMKSDGSDAQLVGSLPFVYLKKDGSMRYITREEILDPSWSSQYTEVKP